MGTQTRRPQKEVSRKLKTNIQKVNLYVSKEESIRSLFPGRVRLSNERKSPTLTSGACPGYLKLELKELVSRGLLSKNNSKFLQVKTIPSQNFNVVSNIQSLDLQL
jgi:hypothetical protein